jgi:hypothetical protein
MQIQFVIGREIKLTRKLINVTKEDLLGIGFRDNNIDLSKKFKIPFNVRHKIKIPEK